MSAVVEKRHKKVLVVDDDAPSQQLMAILLDSLGVSHESAWDGREAVEKVSVENFDLVLMDVRMPHMNGYDAAQRIRQEKKELPIYALTAHAMDYVPAKCSAAGMNGVILKPLDIEAFSTWIRTLWSDDVP
jgi:CheY-like chemotaxis protein